MNRILTLSILFFCLAGNAQKMLRFDYDSAGNQTKRELCLSGCVAKNANEIQDMSDVTDEDLQKFFPEDVISYYPNPVKEQLYLKWELLNDNKVAAIQIYSLNGQLVKDITKIEGKDNHVVAFNNYPRGAYMLLLIYTNGDQKSIKIIKE